MTAPLASAPSRARLRPAALLVAACAAVAALTLPLAGCGVGAGLGFGDAAVAAPQRPLNLSRAVYGRALGLVQEKYVDPVVIGRLAWGGLQKLNSLDPTVTTAEEKGEILVSAQGKLAYRAKRPADDAAAAWAVALADATDKLREVSPKLAADGAEAMYKVVIDAVLEPLDGVSRYEEPDRAKDNRAHREGFGGVGVRIDAQKPQTIQAVLPETPAARAGVKAGDVIRAVDGKSTDGLTLKGLIELLRGPVGAEVTMTLERAGAPKTFDLRLTRAHIADPTVQQRAVGSAHYIRITDFTQSTTAEVEDAVAAAFAQPGRSLTGFVLDLRGNPGGLLLQGVNVSDLFLDSGRVLSSRGRHPDSLQRMNATPGDIARGLPILVLMNGRSASAAEILAAALQDQGRALVVGSASYGKGSIQTLDEMPNGGALILTWARLYSPSGYWFAQVGIPPNICVQGDFPDLRAILEHVRSEHFDPNKPVLARRASDAKPQREAPLKTCPAYNGERQNDVELELATKLLSDGPTIGRLMRAAAQAAVH